MSDRGIVHGLLLLASVALAGCMEPVRVDAPGASPQRFVYSPYKHVALGWRHELPALAREVPALTLAFATGECGAETWDGDDPANVAAHAVADVAAAGLDYIVAAGGEAGTFTCATDTGMEAFVTRYDSQHLIGFDFDIEHSQPDEDLRSLAQRIGAAQLRHRRLRFSVTLATWAGDDEGRASLNADGRRVLAALKEAGVSGYYVNLMVMDYGVARPGNCVVAGTVCDMGRSALKAAHNLHDRFGVPLRRIELTPMIGINDVTANVFTLGDAATLARFVRDDGLAGVHFWSLDRDRACEGDARIVSSHCNGMQDTPPLAYTRAFRDALR